MNNTKELMECLKPVHSSMFTMAGYSEVHWTLVLAFKSTKEVKAYPHCTPEVADDALSSKSLGQWWNQNIKGNLAWKAEVIGPDPSQISPPPPKSMAIETGITDDEIRVAEPGWNGHGIDPLPPEGIRAEDMGSQTTIPVPAAGVVFQELPPTPKMEFSGWREPPPMETSLSKQTQGEILPAWTAPETAAEALELLSERESEIRSIVAQNSERSKVALACQVRDLATHAEAGKTLTELVNVKDVTFKLLDPFRVVLYDAYKFAQDKSKSAIEPIDTAITHIKRQMGAWEAEQERQRQARVAEERRRADEAARELQRKQAEQLTLAEVADALDTGDTAKAEELLAHPIEVPLPYVAPAVVEPTYLAPAGQSTRANWKIDEDAIDLVAFLRAVKDGKLELEVAARFILPNIPALNKQAKSLESTFSIPGFRAKNEPVRSVRRGK